MWPRVLFLAIGAFVLCATAAASSTVRAVRATNGSKPCGPPDFSCIVVQAGPAPRAPLPGEIQVSLASSSVNPSDVDLEEKLGKAEGTLGVDFSGTVVRTGLGVTRFKPGDHVWGTSVGTQQETFNVIEGLAGLAPVRGLNLTEAGTIPEVGSTSCECLVQTGAPWSQPNFTVVITSGSGGTGFIGIQLARAFGAAEIATATSGESNIELVKSLGATIVTDYKKQSIWDVLPQDSVDVVYDNYGAKGTADKAMNSIKEGGVYLLLPGGEDGSLSKHPKAGVKQIKFGLMKPSVHTLDTLKGMFESGQLRPHVEKFFTFEDAKNAYALSASGTVVGKVAITP